MLRIALPGWLTFQKPDPRDLRSRMPEKPENGPSERYSLPAPPPPTDPEPPQMPASQGPRRELTLVRELSSATAMAIFTTFLVASVGALVKSAYIDEESSAVVGASIIFIVSLGATLVITRLSHLSVPGALWIFGAMTGLDTLVYVITGGGESRFLGQNADSLESVLLTIVPLGVVWLFLSRRPVDIFKRLGFVSPASPTAYLIAFGAWAAAYVGLVLWGIITSELGWGAAPDNTTPLLESAEGNLFVAWVIAGVLAPIAEETFFRGYLLGALRTRLGPWQSIFISAGIFTLFHIDPLLFIPIFMVGVMLGWVYLRTGSIWPSIFAHSLNNSLALFAAWQGFD